jgi:hypothetical protein
MEEANTIIDFFKTHPHLHNGEVPWNKPWDKTEEQGYARLNINHIRNEEIRRILRRIEYQSVAHIYKEFGYLVYPERTQVNAWKMLNCQPPHNDSYTSDDMQNGYSEKIKPHRFFTTMTYLNDDYKGGELYFPPQPKLLAGMEIEPVACESVIFQGIDQEHGVRYIRRNYRWSIASWFTIREDKMNLHPPLDPSDDKF